MCKGGRKKRPSSFLPFSRNLQTMHFFLVCVCYPTHVCSYGRSQSRGNKIAWFFLFLNSKLWQFKPIFTLDKHNLDLRSISFWAFHKLTCRFKIPQGWLWTLGQWGFGLFSYCLSMDRLSPNRTIPISWSFQREETVKIEWMSVE